jgi:hypothetical protein
MESPFFQKKIKRISQLLLDKDGALNQQFLSLSLKGGLADNVPEKVKIPLHKRLRTDR